MLCGKMLLVLLSSCVAGESACFDKNVSCANWANAGECDGDNAQVVRFDCPMSCSVCPTSSCKDQHRACHRWSQQGECVTNYELMFAECPFSCGICAVPCEDKNSTFCTHVAEEKLCDDPSADESQFSARVCPETCGTCTRTCVDQVNDCPQWALLGFCHQNPGFMNEVCPRSCQVCDESNCGNKNETCLLYTSPSPRD